jgi:3-methyl-2-oxobutanoate hydroxymethyltransferase
VKRYADMAGLMINAAQTFADEVRGHEFPGPEHTFH